MTLPSFTATNTCSLEVSSHEIRSLTTVSEHSYPSELPHISAIIAASAGSAVRIVISLIRLSFL